MGRLSRCCNSRGTTYVATTTAPIKINPAFLRFFNQAAGVSAALYPAGVTSPTLNFTANILPSKGIQSVTLAIDAQRLSGANISKQFTWSAATAQMAQVTANYSSGSLPLQFNGDLGALPPDRQGQDGARRPADAAGVSAGDRGYSDLVRRNASGGADRILWTERGALDAGWPLDALRFGGWALSSSMKAYSNALRSAAAA